MKWIKRIVVLVVLLIIVAAVVVYINLNHLVRSTVQTQASSSLNLSTEVGGANVSLWGGSVSLSRIAIASPPGFSAPTMFGLGEAGVQVSLGQLRQQPIHVSAITLDKPRLVIEQQGGTFNFRAAMDRMPMAAAQQPSQEPMKLVIDRLDVKDAVVTLRPGLPGLDQEINVNVPSLTLLNIGTGEGAQNGAAVKDVVMQVITALAAKGGEIGNLPDQLKGALSANVAQMTQKLGAEVQKQIDQQIGKLGIPGVDKLGGDVGKAIGDLGKGLGGKKEEPGTAPSEGGRKRRATTR